MKTISESSYSRIWSHTKDNSTFAIIGSKDKDLDTSRYKELKTLLADLMKKNPKIGYTRLDGSYKYKFSDKQVFEKGVLVNNISKEDAIRIASKLNQESIIWKDKNFFGIIDLDGNVLDQFNNPERNIKFRTGSDYGTRLQKDDTNPSRYGGFVFEGGRSVKNLSCRILSLLETTDEEYEAYMAHEKELAGEYYKRLCSNITEERRQKFEDLKALTNDDIDYEKDLYDGFWIPKDFAYAVTDAGKGHHLNPYMDLNVTDIYFMVYENDSIEAALKHLFDTYKADSAYSWGDNFLYALDNANPNAYSEWKAENQEPEEEEE